MLLKSLETPANLPFARELWTADAAPLLRQVDVPVLVIIGKKDLQVDWQGEPLQHAATGHEEVTFFFPENANHVLKQERRLGRSWYQLRWHRVTMLPIPAWIHKPW